MRSVVVQAERKDDRKGFQMIRVEPSMALRDIGIFLDFNDHFQLVEPKESATEALPTAGLVPTALEFLRSSWEDSYHLSHQIADSLVELGVRKASK
jgi:hypothetical protein